MLYSAHSTDRREPATVVQYWYKGTFFLHTVLRSCGVEAAVCTEALYSIHGLCLQKEQTKSANADKQNVDMLTHCDAVGLVSLFAFSAPFWIVDLSAFSGSALVLGELQWCP